MFVKIYDVRVISYHFIDIDFVAVLRDVHDVAFALNGVDGHGSGEHFGARRDVEHKVAIVVLALAIGKDGFGLA